MPTDPAVATPDSPPAPSTLSQDPHVHLEAVRNELARTRELLDELRSCHRPVPGSVSDEAHRPEDRSVPRAPRVPSTSMTSTPAPDPGAALASAARTAANSGERSALLTYLRLKRLAAD